MVVSVYSQPHSPPNCTQPLGRGHGSWEARLGAGWPAALSVPGHCSLVLVEGLCTLGLTPSRWQDGAVAGLFSLPLGTVGPILLAEDGEGLLRLRGRHRYQLAQSWWQGRPVGGQLSGAGPALGWWPLQEVP